MHSACALVLITCADASRASIPAQIASYPAYLYALRVHNKRTYYASEVIFVALLCNFVLSGVLILDKRYAGRTSIIGLLSNTFLCLGKVYGYRTCVPIAS